MEEEVRRRKCRSSINMREEYLVFSHILCGCSLNLWGCRMQSPLFCCSGAV